MVLALLVVVIARRQRSESYRDNVVVYARATT
jgi:hypothetical protein